MKNLRSHIDSGFSFPNFESGDASSIETTSELPQVDNTPSVNDINDEVNENNKNESARNGVLSENTSNPSSITYQINDRSENEPQRGQVEKSDIDEN